MKVIEVSESLFLHMTPEPDARHDMGVSLDATLSISIPSPVKSVCPSCGRARVGYCSGCAREATQW